MWLWIKFRTSRTDSNSQTLLRKTSASCCKLYKKTVLEQLSNLISFFVGAEIFGVRFWELTTAEITIAVVAPGSIWKTQLIFLLLNWTECAPNISRKTSLWVDLIFVYELMDCVNQTEKLLKRQPQWNVACNFHSTLRNENYTLFLCHQFRCIKVSIHCFRLSLCLLTSTSGYSEIICAVSKLIFYIIDRFIFFRSLLCSFNTGIKNLASSQYILPFLL